MRVFNVALVFCVLFPLSNLIYPSLFPFSFRCFVRVSLTRTQTTHPPCCPMHPSFLPAGKNSTKTLLADRRAGATKRRSVIGKIGAALPTIGRKRSTTSGGGGADDAGLLDADDDENPGNAEGSSFDAFRKSSLKKMMEKESASKKVAAVEGEEQGEYDMNGGLRDFGLDGEDFGDAPPPPPRTASFKRANPAPVEESDYIAPGGGTTGGTTLASKPAPVVEESDYIAPGGGTTGSMKQASKQAPVEVEGDYIAPGGAVVKAAAAEAVVTLPAPAVDTKEIQVTLGLDDEGISFYIALWEYVDVNKVNRIAGKTALGFLQSSNLSNKQLRDIWAASDTKQPRGSLTRDEFFVACKLVALKQQGKPAQVSNLTIEVGPPKFSEVEPQEDDDDEVF